MSDPTGSRMSDGAELIPTKVHNAARAREPVASPSLPDDLYHQEASAGVTEKRRAQRCPPAPDATGTVGDAGPSEPFAWVPTESPSAVPGPAVRDAWIDLPTIPTDETGKTGEPASWAQAVPWIVSRRASAIVDKLSIYERRAIDEAFHRVVDLLTQFPHPSSARGIDALAEAGASLETIEDAARLKTFWADSPGLWLVRRHSRLHGTIVPGRVVRNGAHLMTWALAARVLAQLDVQAAATAISTDWLRDWLAMAYPLAVGEPRLRAGYFNFPVYIDFRAAWPDGDDGEFMRISPARLRYAFA